jgi:hypothetical protein
MGNNFDMKISIIGLISKLLDKIGFVKGRDLKLNEAGIEDLKQCLEFIDKIVEHVDININCMVDKRYA